MITPLQQIASRAAQITEQHTLSYCRDAIAREYTSSFWERNWWRRNGMMQRYCIVHVPAVYGCAGQADIGPQQLTVS